MSSFYGKHIHLSIFGQSHGVAVGMTLDNVPAGLKVDLTALSQFMNRRAPGMNDLSTPRKESDLPEFLSGIHNGYTCGAPVTAVIYNTNTRSQDYTSLRTTPRPGHADYTAQIKYAGYQDASGGGHFSGRLTAPMCIAGGLCKQWLEEKGIAIRARIVSIGSITDEQADIDPVKPDLSRIPEDFAVVSPEARQAMRSAILDAKAKGDSLGGVIQCYITGLPAGLGDPMFCGMESRIAQIVFGIPAVKGLSFGSGFQGCQVFGSENNDAFCYRDGIVRTETNHCGGILGGITNAMPLVFQVGIKPTPSIALPQQTVDLNRQCETQLQIRGRHDPCIVPRAVAVVEAAAAIAVFDAIQSL